MLDSLRWNTFVSIQLERVSALRRGTDVRVVSSVVDSVEEPWLVCSLHEIRPDGTQG